MSISVNDLVMAARARIRCMNVAELERARVAGEVAIIDVRDGAERTSKPSIPGAVHASRGMLEFYLDPKSDMHMPVFGSGKPLVFVCGSGGRASLAAATACDFGLIPVYYLEGGMRAWLDRGLPTEA